MGAIDQVKERLDIVEIISANGVNLRRTGRSYVGFCPFHPNSRTPAFTVYPDTQSFYCFGCHASGTVFDFVMRKQGIDFRDALEQLAARAGVQLTERNEEERQIDQQRTRLLEINAAAAKYFNYVLLNLQRGQAGRDYVARRGIDAATIEAFQIGYSLEDWGHLLTYLTEKKGFTAEEVEAAGLAIHHEQRSHYDRFRGRVIFPIRNARGEVVGFGGRALGDAQPKYLNTPETLLFKKGELLYGLDLARDAIRSEDRTVVVEGYVDVITAHQHGFRNVVAPLGTALTKSHVAMLKKLSHNVYLALDADAAGQKATLRGLNVLQESEEETGETHPVTTAQGLVRWQSDVNLRIIKMPEGQDPDEVIKADPERWRTLLAAATPVMDFYIEAYTAGLDLSLPQEQRSALDRLLPLLAQLDGTQQRVYLARLEQIIGIKAELILDLLRGSRSEQRGRNRETSLRPGAGRGSDGRPQPVPDAPSAPVTPRPSSAITREDHLLALVLRFPSTCAAVEELIAEGLKPFAQTQAMLGWELASLLERIENRLIWQAWLTTPIDSRPPTATTLAHWAQGLEETLREQAARLIALELPRPQEYRYRQEAEKCALQVRRMQAKRWIRRLTQQMQDIEDQDELAQLLALASEFQHYETALSTPKLTSLYDKDLRKIMRRD